MNKPHKHAEIIKDWAEGAEIEARFPPNGVWVTATKPAWDEHTEYRVKPAAPVVETKMTEAELAEICHDNGRCKPSITRAVNAAIARLIADGHVVSKAEYDRLAAQYTEVQGLAFELQKRGAERDMAVARAVTHDQFGIGFSDAELLAIVAKVKP